LYFFLSPFGWFKTSVVIVVRTSPTFFLTVKMFSLFLLLHIFIQCAQCDLYVGISCSVFRVYFLYEQSWFFFNSRKMSIILFYSFIDIYLYYSQTIKSAILKCVLVYSQNCTAVTTLSFQNSLLTAKRSLVPTNSHFHLASPGSCNH
jgi:hypothetical protein